MSGTSRCWAEIDLQALRGNLTAIRDAIGPNRRIITVVKADAYGHGLRAVASLLMQNGTDMFGVANLTEAHHIRQVGAGWPILALSAALPEEVREFVHANVRPSLSSLREVESFAAAASSARVILPVHLKVDTGMGRLGFPPDDTLEAALTIQQHPSLRLEGLMTHFADADGDNEFTEMQLKRFNAVLAILRRHGVEPEWIHAANSAGLLYHAKSRFNAVRPGLAVYGLVPDAPADHAPSSRLAARLIPACVWKARVSFVKTVPAGTPLSYGCRFVTHAETRVATVSAGYGDGFLRKYGDRGSVLIGGRPCRVLGRVTMDQILADVTRVPGIDTGDEVVLMGRQGGATIAAGDLAAWGKTIPWEVLTAITGRVPRVYRGQTVS